MHGHDQTSALPEADPAAPGRHIVFIHGMWHGAWTWDDFRPRFEQAGFRTHAWDLPEHGAGFTSTEAVRKISVQNCLDDLLKRLEAFPTPPILIGHSFGCHLAELCVDLLPKPPAALVLMAPTRPSIYRWSVASFAVRHPILFFLLNWKRSMWPPVSTPALAREMLFGYDLSDAEVERLHGKLRDESFRISLELTVSWPPRRVRLNPGQTPAMPTRIVGAENDGAVGVSHVHKVAEEYGVKARIFDGMPHDLMLAPGWETVADWIISELRDLG